VTGDRHLARATRAAAIEMAASGDSGLAGSWRRVECISDNVAVGPVYAGEELNIGIGQCVLAVLGWSAVTIFSTSTIGSEYPVSLMLRARTGGCSACCGPDQTGRRCGRRRACESCPGAGDFESVGGAFSRAFGRPRGGGRW
jgi:hypothetical protein